MHNEEKYKIYHRIACDSRGTGYHLPRCKPSTVEDLAADAQMQEIITSGDVYNVIRAVRTFLSMPTGPLQAEWYRKT